jgi:hypothetical protein
MSYPVVVRVVCNGPDFFTGVCGLGAGAGAGAGGV